MKNVQRTVLGASAVVTMVTLGITAQAQRPARTPQPAPSPTVRQRTPAPAPTLAAQLAVPLQAPQFAPEIKPALVGKKAFDPKALAGRVRQVNGVTLLKINNGREYPLMPIGAEPTPPARLQMKAIPPHLLPYKAHIEAPILAGKRVIKLPDIIVQNPQTAVRDQGSRGTCTAFAALAGMEGWAKRTKGETLDLSENHAFQLFMAADSMTCTSSGGYWTWKTGDVLTTKGTCHEALMPYSATCPTSIPARCDGRLARKQQFRFSSTEHFFTPKYGGTGALRADNTNLLEAYLKAGKDIVYGVDVAGNGWSNGTANTGVIDVQLDSAGNPVGGYGGHAMLLVGYNRNQRYFIFKNSWGTDSGHDGYIYLSYDYVQVYGKYGYAVGGVTGPGLG